MKYRQVIAIIPPDSLDQVENELYENGMQSLTVSRITGKGDYKNFYKKDFMSDYYKIDIFIDEDKTRKAVDIIAQTAHQGLDSDGIIAVLPVDEFVHIKDYSKE